jgi:hypothetical protein
MRPLAMLMITGALAATGCAATPEQQARTAGRQATAASDLQTTLAGYTAGTAQICLPLSNPRRTRYYGDTILYEVNGNLLYRTDTTGGCTLQQQNILVTRSVMGRSCSGDIITTVDSGSRFPTGSCAFGEFVPYRKNRS